MKSLKDASLLIVVLLGVIVIVGAGYIATKQCEALERERPFARLAIDNAQRIAVAVGSARVADAVSNADILNSVRYVLVSSNVPETGRIEPDGGTGRLAEPPQPARGQIEDAVQYLSKKMAGWIVR